VSRRGHVFKPWPQLSDELSRYVGSNAVLDGEICCLASDGRAEFYNLLFRRSRPHFMAFDLLWMDGQDLRNHPLCERKRLLKRLLPKTECSVRLVQHIESRGCDLFRAACEHDLEGILAKWRGRHVSTRPAHVLVEDPQSALQPVGRSPRAV
jgi:bifunctional non-homologous end joining protein LigD